MPEVHDGFRLEYFAVMYILTCLLVLLVDCVCSVTESRQNNLGSSVYLVPLVSKQAIGIFRLGSLGHDIFYVAPGKAIYSELRIEHLTPRCC